MRPRLQCPFCGLNTDKIADHIALAHPGIVMIAQDMDVERALTFEMTEEMLKEMGFERVPGYPTPFTRREVLGAFRNGTRIVKTKTEPGDGRAIGARGTVLGSLMHPQLGVAYFVEWDERPKLAIFVVAAKIGALLDG